MNSKTLNFVKYFNKFYGPNGIYPCKKHKKDITWQEIKKGCDAVLKKNPNHKFYGDSFDRELIRDEMIDLNIIDPTYNKKRSNVKEDVNADQNYYLNVDLDERGEYAATLYDYDDNVVWDCDTEQVEDMIEGGFLKYKPDQDLDRLAEYLGDLGVIPKGSTIDDEKQEDEEDDMEENRRMRESKKSNRRIMLENRLRAVIRPIVRRALKDMYGDKSYQLNKEEYDY